MALTNCTECGKELSDTAVTCVNCGYKLKTISSKSKIAIIVIVIIIILSGLISYNIYGNYKERQNQVEIEKALDNFHNTLENARQNN